MGLFSFFSKEAGQERRRASAQKKLSNMYYQSAERNAAAHDMAQMAQQGDEKALRILLARFEKTNPSSTVDREEKEYAMELLKGIGEPAIEGTKTHVRETSEAIFWPMRYLGDTLSDEDYCAFIADLLASTTDEYVRDPKKKLGLVQLAKEHRTPEIETELTRFIHDFDESVRFHAIDIVHEWNVDGLKEALIEQWADPDEDSRRVWARMADIFRETGWSVGEKADAIKEHLPQGVSLSGKGTIQG